MSRNPIASAAVLGRHLTDATWTADAPCRGHAGWFDTPAGSPDTVHRDPIVREALALCRRCPYTRPCLDRVRPRQSGADVIAGGIVWRNGEPVRPS